MIRGKKLVVSGNFHRTLISENILSLLTVITESNPWNEKGQNLLQSAVQTLLIKS